jgi:hypothetical protein
MPQSLAKILIHTVFSTKERRPFLRDGAKGVYALCLLLGPALMPGSALDVYPA